MTGLLVFACIIMAIVLAVVLAVFIPLLDVSNIQ